MSLARPPLPCWLVFSLLVGMTLPSAAQFATLQGQVVAAHDRAPLPGVNVILDASDGTRLGVATDADGGYLLRRIPPGTYVLSASYIGFQTHSDTLALDFSEQRRLDIQLQPKATDMGGNLVVEEERTGAEREAMAGFATIRGADLARIPMPGVAPDLAAYLLTVPGIVSVGDRGGQLFVRGGTATQNLVLIDGIPLYQPFHIVGFYAAFPGNLVSYADVYAGGFGARYGGRISSVVDVAMRNGNKRRVVGSASLAPFLSTVHLEVPVEPEKVSLVASVRESVIERVSPDLLGERLPFRFGDRFVKLHAFLNRTSNLSVTALSTHDEGTLTATRDTARTSRWRNEALGARYFFLPYEYPAAVEAAAYGTRLRNSYRINGTETRYSEARSFQFSIIYSYLLGDTQIHGGFFAGSSWFAYDLGEGPILNPGQPPLSNPIERNVSSGGLFLTMGIPAWPTLYVEPGVRLQSYTNSIGTTLEPRLRLRLQPDGPAGLYHLSVAMGVYRQQIYGLSNDQDVTDVFTAWSAVPPNSDLPTAYHFILGYHSRQVPWLDFNAEAYYKRLINLFTSTDPEQEQGFARGLDLKVAATPDAYPWLYAQVGYSLAQVSYEGFGPLGRGIRQGGAARYRPSHDRRHQLNLLVVLDRPPYALRLQWQYGSGLPFFQYTQAQLLRELLGDEAVGSLDELPEELPAYHRLDASAELTFDYRRARLTLQAGVVNAYDRNNIFDIDAASGARTNQLPLVPTFGLKVEVR